MEDIEKGLKEDKEEETLEELAEDLKEEKIIFQVSRILKYGGVISIAIGGFTDSPIFIGVGGLTFLAGVMGDDVSENLYRHRVQKFAEKAREEIEDLQGKY